MEISIVHVIVPTQHLYDKKSIVFVITVISNIELQRK